MSRRIVTSSGRTLRHRRIRSRVSGTVKRPRLTVFRSLSQVYAQLIDDVTGQTLLVVRDRDVLTKGTKQTKTERAFLVGQTLAKKALTQKIAEAVFDRGGYQYHGRVRAVAEGARDAGLKF